MKQSGKVTFVMVIVAFVITLTTVFSFFVSFSNKNNITPPLFDSSSTSFESAWLNEYGSHFNLSMLSKRKPEFDCETPLIVWKEIPSIESDSAIFFRTNNLVVNVYIDDKSVYFTNKDGYYHNLSSFNSYCYIPISYSDVGKQIKLEIFKTPVSLGYCIDNFSFGKSENVLYSAFASDISIIVASVMTIIVGVIFIWMSIISRKTYEHCRGLAFFGMFSLLIGVWFLTDTLWLYNFFKDVSLMEFCSHVFVSAAVPCFMMYIYDVFNIYSKKYYIILTSIGFFIFLLFLILDLTGAFSYGNSVFIQHIYILLCGGTLLVEMISYLSKVAVGEKQSKIFNIGVIFFTAFALIDVGRYYQGNEGDNSLFTRFGFFILAVTAVSVVSMDVIALLKLGIQAGKIGKIAFTDANTGLGNPAAFKNKFEELDRTKSNYSYIGLIQFDVNNLKVINDTLGHEAGDLLIKTAAEIIERSFGVIGKCYRVGGDEFVAITTYNHAPLACEDAINKFESYIDHFNNNPNKPFELRIAYGVAYYQNTTQQFQSLKEVHKLADQRMYNKKKELKARYAKKPEEAVIR